MSTDWSDVIDGPDRLQIGVGAHRQWVSLVPALYARHEARAGAKDSKDVAGRDAILTLDEGAIAVFRVTGTDRPPVAETTIGPVYELQPGASLAVPTGRVFIRFADSVKAETRRDELREAGYGIDRLLSYAPNAAWLTAHSGRIGDALRGIDRLVALNGVEHVEPEVRMTRQSRK